MIWRPTIAILLLIPLAGCASLWTRIDAGTVAFVSEHYAASLPQDWVRAEIDKSLYITRDGLSIQRITIEFHEHDKAFERTGQKSAADMLPSELADRYIAEMRAADEHGLPSLEVLSNRPATIDVRPGFALHLRFLSERGLRYERLVNGFANQDGLFVISFQAPTLHFFERDRDAFHGVVGSFRAI